MNNSLGYAKPGLSEGDRRGTEESAWSSLRRHKFVYLAGVGLPIVIFITFVGIPILYTLYLSFFNWDGIGTHKTFVGIENYQTLVQDPNFILSLKNTAIWTLLTLIVPVSIGFLLAVLLSTAQVYLSGLIRSLLFLPTTMSLVTVGIMFSLILNPVFGALNTILRNIGLGFLIRDWLGDTSINLYTLILTYAWVWVGFPLTMFYAGIRQIPAELYETAQIEGANLIQTLRHVTIPLLRPVFTIVTVLAVINSVKAFDLVFTMTRGGPYGQTSVLGYYMYLQAFLSYRYGYGAAISVAILAISSGFAYIYLRRVAGESLHGAD
jgi:multiple sugar transport system permease protein/raffinose/stachyose/melibiose transport system permease protein